MSDVQISLCSYESIDLYIRWAHKNGCWPVTMFTFSVPQGQEVLKMDLPGGHGPQYFSIDTDCTGMVKMPKQGKAYVVQLRNARGVVRPLNIIAQNQYEAFYEAINFPGVSSEGWRVIGIEGPK